MSVFQMLLEGKSGQPTMGGELDGWVGVGCEGRMPPVVQAVVKVRRRMRVKVMRRWVGEAVVSCGCMVCSLDVRMCFLLYYISLKKVEQRSELAITRASQKSPCSAKTGRLRRPKNKRKSAKRGARPPRFALFLSDFGGVGNT